MQCVSKHLHKTPVEYSSALSGILGTEVYLKLDCLQVMGSFKTRGALFALSELRDAGATAVSACSAGNHGMSIAWAAHRLGLRATIFVPASIDRSKLEEMQRLQATVRISEFPGYDETEAWALEEAERLGAPYVGPYNSEEVMAANGGTVGLEVLEQVPQARTFLMPVGGGAHAAGFTSVVHERMPDARFVVCQHRDSPGFKLSMERGEAVTDLPAIDTLAYGLEGGIGVETFALLKDVVDETRLVSESELRAAMRWMAAEHRLIIEGSSAVPIAACMKLPPIQTSGPVVIFVSGRNIAIQTYRDVLNEPFTD